MASTGVDYAKTPAFETANDKNSSDREKYAGDRAPSINESLHNGQIDHTHRKLKSRHIQLIGIGGTIGTALYVQIGKSLIAGGPGSLFLAFTLWCSVILAVTISMAEMVTYLPISSPFIRFAGRWVDESIGFATGWNFFIFEAAMVPFEVTACNLIIHFWSEAVPVGGIIAIIMVLYAIINIMAVKWYGETEFWAALGKMLLIVGLIIFTFIVMVGGNPQHDHFGFRYWYEPGAFNEYYHTGSTGRFMGFMQCLIAASFTIAGPDYVSMAAGEAENPRKVMPRAFNAVFYRLTAFFMLGSLCVGILVPYNDQTLSDAYTNGQPGAAASPYVVAMNRLGIPVLPHIVNAMVLTAAFSAGNSYVYCASRSLFGLSLEGKAPKFLSICLKNGVPIYSVIVVLLISLLSFLQVSSNTATVLGWFVSLITASQLINYCVICATFICFHRALKAQGIDRKSLPYMGKLQPYAAWYACIATFVMAFMGGYTVFLPGNWDVSSFLFSYMMIFIFPVLFIMWKLIHKTKFYSPREVDLKQDLASIEEYTRNYVPTPSKNFYDRGLNFLFG
ncbi:putative Amino acid permease/ SLC12A domain-containing protein [Seiridium cardinale]|uniref:Amino acid permease/ SLC12A domain-containing protein n=1 Tax=Seiridium cardinale TaxID=138064 RepID=A0ABR2XP98_9PEZI